MKLVHSSFEPRDPISYMCFIYFIALRLTEMAEIGKESIEICQKYPEIPKFEISRTIGRMKLIYSSFEL